MSTFIDAHNGYGSLFAFSSIGSSGTFNNIANILSITPPTFSRATVDITNHGTTDYYEQCISGGIIKTGSVGITAVYLTSTSVATTVGNYEHTLIPEAFQNGTRIGWKIVVGTASSNNLWYGDAFVTGYSFTVPTEGRIEWKADFKITGKPTGPATTT